MTGRRGRWGLGWLAALLLVVIGHTVLLALWISADGYGGAGVCCGLDLPTAQDALSPGRVAPAWYPVAGLVPLAAMSLHRLWPADPDFTLHLGLLACVAAQLCLFEAARWLRGPWTGVLAAALTPLVPAIAFLFRRWDVHGPGFLLVALALVLVLRARSFSRTLPTLGFAAVVALAACHSPRSTDNLLLVLALGGLAGGGWLRGLAAGRDARGESLSRRWSLVQGLLLLAAVALVGWWLRNLLAPSQGYTEIQPLQRYLGEVNDPDHQVVLAGWHWRKLGLYAMHLYWRGLTPWLAIPLDLALVFYLWRGRGRAELLGLALVPLLFLSVIPKKNFYYLSVVYPVLPLILALGLAAVPWRPLRWTGAALLCLLGAVQLGARSQPAYVAGTPLEGVQWQWGSPDFGGLFQTADQELELAPRTPCWEEAVPTLQALVAGEGSCPQALGAVGMPQEQSRELWFRLLAVCPALVLGRYDHRVDAGVERLLVLEGRGSGDGGREREARSRLTEETAAGQIQVLGALTLCDGNVQVLGRTAAPPVGGTPAL